MNVKRLLFVFALIFYIAYIANSLIYGYLSVPATIPAIFMVVASLIYYPQCLFNKITVSFFFYAIILVLSYLIGHLLPFSYGSGILSVIIEVAFILPAILISSILIDLNDNKLYKIVYYTTTVAICITLLLTTVTNVLIPGVLRSAALSVSSSGVEVNTYLRLGIPNYTAMHSFALLLPVFLYRLRKSSSDRTYNKIFLICVIVILFNSILNFSISTMIIYSCLALLLGIIFSAESNSRNMLSMVLLGLLFIVFSNESSLIYIFGTLDSFFEGTAMANKVNDIRNLIIFGDASGSSISTRQSLHISSIETFFDNPIFGGEQIGGHSTIFDQMARLGLVGFLPYILMIYWGFQSWYRLLTNDSKWFYIIAWIGIITLLITKGLFGSLGWMSLFVIIPSFLLYKPDEALKTK